MQHILPSSFWVVLVSVDFFYRCAPLLIRGFCPAGEFLYHVPPWFLCIVTEETKQGPAVAWCLAPAMLPSIGTCILEAVLRLWFSSFLLHPLGASIVGLSSWPWHYWKCTFMRSTAKSSTSVLFAQWPSSQQTAPWLTWPASIQQSLTRLLSEYFVITRSSPLLVSSTTASTFHLSWFFLFPFFFVACSYPGIRRAAPLSAGRGLFLTVACSPWYKCCLLG